MGDKLYLFSDGLIDQMGRPEGKRFSRTRLRNFLRANGYLPVEEQVALLQEAIRTHMSGYPQMDDMLFLALEV